ncbi:MAG TPA: metal-dependent hydrolase [Methanoregulaceae archaeon]|nr:metal-dependent hydrolase [Methanoregulaceae archaeon]
MLTRHHIILALLCSLIIGSVTFRFDPLLIVALSAGTVVGVVLPDIHMKKPKMSGLKTIAWYIVHIGILLCIPVIHWIYKVFPGVYIRPDDKRLTHSLPGIAVYFIIFAGLSSIPLILFRENIPGRLVLVILGGILSGLFLHLIEDLCTMKGIQVLFPFNETIIRGSVRPCNIDDTRILQFHYQHASILGILISLQFVIMSDVLLTICGFFAVFLCIGYMVWRSDVRVIFPEYRHSDPREAVPA